MGLKPYRTKADVISINSGEIRGSKHRIRTGAHKTSLAAADELLQSASTRAADRTPVAVGQDVDDPILERQIVSPEEYAAQQSAAPEDMSMRRGRGSKL